MRRANAAIALLGALTGKTDEEFINGTGEPAPALGIIRPRLLGDAGSPPATDRAVWWHLCAIERDMSPVAIGAACPHCGRQQPAAA